jgi:hypothetical protein
MSGYDTVIRIKRLERELDELGFIMAHSRHRFDGDYGDVLSIKPKDADSLPIYSRDAEIFTGTILQLEQWLRGVEWARSYDKMLKVSDETKRAKKEQHVRDDQLLRILKDEPALTIKDYKA